MPRGTIRIRSCVTPLSTVAGKSVTTLEGLPAWYAQQKKLASAPEKKGILLAAEARTTAGYVLVLVAAAFGVRASVVSGGVMCVIGVLVCGLALPRFVLYDSRM